MSATKFPVYGLLAVFILLPVFSETVIEQKGPCACKTDQGWINLEPLDSKDAYNPK